MEHDFTPVIRNTLSKYFGEAAEDLFEKSPLLQYINLKTVSATRGSKARSSFANLYAIYVLVEDYVRHKFHKKGDYSKYQGAQFSKLFMRQRELPFGRKLQNHALNHRLNEEFRKFFPQVDAEPILRVVQTKRYWINQKLIVATLGRKSFKLARPIIEIIDAYAEMKQASFERFIQTCLKLRDVSKKKGGEVEDFVLSLLAPNVDARIFEIVSYAILKYFYHDQTVYFGFQLDELEKSPLVLYKTGRTNANDGGIDFVMKPLGRFFQVTETLDVRKYFLDIDKIERYPMTFVIKSSHSIDDLRNKLKDGAERQYAIKAIVDKYMACIEEVVNIPVLQERFRTGVVQGYLSAIMDEIVRQSKVEFSYEGPDDVDADGDLYYSPQLRQVNFPGQVATPNKNVSGGVDSASFNRPAVYVRGERLKIQVAFGDTGISDLTGTSGIVGYPIPAYPLQVRPVFKGRVMNGIAQTLTTNIREISPGGVPYTLVADQLAKLDDTVGFTIENIQFKYLYNVTGETFVDTNGNGAFDAGDILTDENGNGAFDEDWREVPGWQTTSHLIYRLAAAPTDVAKNQSTPTGRLYMKIVDFTCNWAQGQKTPQEVFDKIWKTDNFWTPSVGTPPVPDNVHGFHGVGDPTEFSRPDENGTMRKCYTYEHLASTDVTVDKLLDDNAGKCGGWCKFLPTFAGTHGCDIRPVYVLPRAYRSIAAGNLLLTAAAVNALAVGDEFYLCVTQLTPTYYCTADDFGSEQFFVYHTLDGQAHPAASGTLMNSWADGHAISFLDNNHNGQFDSGELLFDPSYAHATGLAKTGFPTLQQYEDATMLKLHYARVRVVAQPIVAADGSINVMNRVFTAFSMEVDDEKGKNEVYLYVP